jgi:hypothetical protein
MILFLGGAGNGHRKRPAPCPFFTLHIRPGKGNGAILQGLGRPSARRAFCGLGGCPGPANGGKSLQRPFCYPGRYP